MAGGLGVQRPPQGWLDKVPYFPALKSVSGFFFFCEHFQILQLQRQLSSITNIKIRESIILSVICLLGISTLVRSIWCAGAPDSGSWDISSPVNLISTKLQHHPLHSKRHNWWGLVHQKHSHTLPSLPQHQRHRQQGKSITQAAATPCSHPCLSTTRQCHMCLLHGGVQKKVSARGIVPFLQIEWIILCNKYNLICTTSSFRT
jgi:hypothetical protein